MTRQPDQLDLIIVASYLLLIFIDGMWLFALAALFSFSFGLGWPLLR